MSRTPADLAGRRFTRLLVLEQCGRKEKAVLWLCVCDCGKEFTAKSSNLIAGNVQSCGCLRRDTCKRMGIHIHNDRQRSQRGARRATESQRMKKALKPKAQPKPRNERNESWNGAAEATEALTQAWRWA